jgi:hypothetical protein
MKTLRVILAASAILTVTCSVWTLAATLEPGRDIEGSWICASAIEDGKP